MDRARMAKRGRADYLIVGVQHLKVLLADEVLHIGDVQVADPVVEVADPQDHTERAERKPSESDGGPRDAHATRGRERARAAAPPFFVPYSCFMMVSGGCAGSVWRNCRRPQMSL